MYALRLFDQHPDLLYERFLQTDFGKLYQTIPFKELAALVPAPSGSKSGRGCKAWLKVEGGIALLIAKHYLQLSDAMLVERLNTDWSLQMFCGIQLRPHEVIKDEDLPGRWHGYVGKCHQAGADAIYATNANRKFCTTHNIATCFVRKGKQPADEIRSTQQSTMRSLLAKERSTRLEGSFGNEKNHYLLNKIKAGTQSTELVWIFFGILCSNAVLLTKRRCRSQSSKKAA
jgi:hypothetical protein